MYLTTTTIVEPTLVSCGAILALHESGEELSDFLDRHQAGDHGAALPELDAANDLVRRSGNGFVYSTYALSTGRSLEISTARWSGQRMLTQVRMPDEEDEELDLYNEVVAD